MSDETREWLKEKIFNGLGLCGCYPDEVLVNLVCGLQIIHMASGRPSAWQALCICCGSSTSAYIAMTLYDRAGLIEHGSSMPNAWLTEDGERFRREMVEGGLKLSDFVNNGEKVGERGESNKGTAEDV